MTDRDVSNDTATPDLTPVKRALLALEDMRRRLDASEARHHEPIAIVGMACRFPGQADDLDRFWQLLSHGVDAVTEVPGDRWDANAFYDPDPDVPLKTYTRAGAFLGDVGQFDPLFFGISPREAAKMDPQQRLLLEVTWEALERSGTAPSSLSGTRTGVFVGQASPEYSDISAASLKGGATEMDAFFGTGTTPSITAGRISYVLGLQGPAMTIDTACSSSLAGVHLACQSLRTGESEVAIAGGVNLILGPWVTVYMSKAKALSPTGRCRTFDASADGYVRGEGCGIVVLKRLSDALADGDPVLAVIRGTALNHDGRSGGLTVPNGQAQHTLIRTALDDAGIDAKDVSYVEAHGTGTPLGDPIEMRAIDAAYGTDRDRAAPGRLGQEQHRSPRGGGGHRRSHQGRAGAPARRHPGAPPLHRAQSPHRLGAHRRARPHRAHRVARARRRPRRRRQRVRLQRYQRPRRGERGAAARSSAPAQRPERPLHVLPLSARNEASLGEFAGEVADGAARRRRAGVCPTSPTPWPSAATSSSTGWPSWRRQRWRGGRSARSVRRR